MSAASRTSRAIASLPLASRALASRALVSLALVSLALVSLAGCPTPVTPPDASFAPDATGDGATPSRVSVELRADPETLEDDTALVQLTLGVYEIEVQNDRGALSVRPERAVELAAGAGEIMLTGATPGVYAEVELELASGGWGPSLLLVLDEPSSRVALVIDEPLRLLGRCATPLELGASGTLVFTVELELDEIAHVLRESELPPPVDGVVHVDLESAPLVVAEILTHLRRLRLECEETHEP